MRRVRIGDADARGNVRALFADLLRQVAEAGGDPDLLEVLPDGSADREWVSSIRDELEQRFQSRQDVLLVHCEYVPDGYTAVAAMTPRSAGSVRKGDDVCAGFAALSEGGGEVRIVPRVYRMVCQNGQVVPHAHLAEVQACFAPVREMVSLCLAGRTLDEFVREARALASIPVDDPEVWLSRVDPMVEARRVVERFEEEGDPSAWGLVNAITAEARGVDHFPTRLRAEEAATRLARLLAPLAAGEFAASAGPDGVALSARGGG
ncbi:MAG: hypothetical protein HY812_07400 [Planctomycetes bacterium]|nr:hypothetical protein [Planctomycetota bacterium]